MYCKHFGLSNDECVVSLRSPDIFMWISEMAGNNPGIYFELTQRNLKYELLKTALKGQIAA